MKYYVYHVVYSLPNGGGSITIYRNKKMDSAQQITDCAKYISDNYLGKNTLVIENFIRLKNTKIIPEKAQTAKKEAEE